MSKPPPPSLEDYDAIEAAVRETERGRWFLSEFARRNRAADTAQILDALASLEARIQAPPALPILHPIEPRQDDDDSARISGVFDGGAEVRPTPSLMLAPPADQPPEPEVTELAVVPPRDDAPAGLDLEFDTFVSGEEPAEPPMSAARMRVETELEVAPPLDDSPASLDLDLELETFESAEEPAQPPVSAVRMRVEAELADLAGLRASLSRPDASPPPPAARSNTGAARPAPLLESLSEAEKALLFA